MDDNLDRANDELEIGLAHALRMRKPEGPKATGKCLWCYEPIGKEQRWCDAEHRNGWEREQASRFSPYTAHR